MVVNMKRFFLILGVSLLCSSVQAIDENIIEQNNKIQSKKNNIGTKILNSNKLEKRVIFVYSEEEKAKLLKKNDSITKRQIVVYQETYNHIETDDELAGYIAREIPSAIRSYEGLGSGWLSSAKMKLAPKKYEIVFDKLAVDYMVTAGYNPLGLITLINKTCPQCRQDKFSSKNLTSKRLAHIYERIYFKYPAFLENNTYLENEYYQNFLLNSQNNRKLLSDKVKTGNLKQEVKYE